MNNERTTHGGKGDSKRPLSPQFDINYGNIQGFHSNKVFQHENGSWAFWKKDGGVASGLPTRLRAIEACQQHYGGE